MNELVNVTAIGDLYRLGGSSFVEGVNFRLECGRLLEIKKSNMAHGEWLPWLEANKYVLGFDKGTAQRLIKVANASSTTHLDEPEALSLSRRMWGNKEKLVDCLRQKHPNWDSH
ncbi:MAG: DUF3102 domain-containing protein [Proteobacteria bacterium]|nr:DUF3102 domain-containing protein [Pseudomonadota bacterium]